MGWDSNPRNACTFAGFQDRCLQPLGHPSKEETPYGDGLMRQKPVKRNNLIGGSFCRVSPDLFSRKKLHLSGWKITIIPSCFSYPASYNENINKRYICPHHDQNLAETFSEP